MKRIWLVEKVGFGPGITLALIWARISGGCVQYASGNPWVIRFWRNQFPEDAFDEISGVAALKKRTHLALYRMAEARRDEIEKSGAYRALQHLYSNPDWSPIIRKAVISDGFLYTVLGLEASRLRIAGKRVYWLPYLFKPGFLRRASFLQNIPFFWRIAIRTRGAILLCLGPLLFTGKIGWSLVRHGIGIRRVVPKDFAISQITTDGTSIHGRIFDEALYGGGVLSADKILHILKDPPSRGYAEAARERGLTWVYPASLPCPILFFIRWYICGYLPFALRCIIESIRSPTSLDVMVSALRAGSFLIEAKLFACFYRPRVYFGFDSYSIKADVSAMVWKEWSGCYVGWIHAAPWLPLYYYHNTVMPILMCAGPAIQEMFGETLQHVGKVITVGHFQAETALRPSAKLLEFRTSHMSNTLVSAFDSSYSPFWGLTRTVNEEFFEGLLELVEVRPKVFLYLKRKYKGEENPVYERLAERFEQHPRIRVSYDDNPYHVIAISDLVIGITSSTVGWEALSCRKPALFFDPRRHFKDNPAWKYGLVCNTKEELIDRFDEIQNHQYLSQDKWNMIMKREAGFIDEKPLTAMKEFLVNVVNAQERTVDRSHPY